MSQVPATSKSRTANNHASSGRCIIHRRVPLICSRRLLKLDVVGAIGFVGVVVLGSTLLIIGTCKGLIKKEARQIWETYLGVRVGYL